NTLTGMKNSRLLTLVSLLSAKEMKRLDLFVRSPYFNQHDGVLALWEVVAAAYPDFEEGLSRERLAQTLLDRPIRTQQLLDLTSYLTRLVERYLAQERWESDPMQPQEQLVLSLREREAAKAHQRAYRKWQRMIPQPASAGELLWQYRIAAEGMHTRVLQRDRKADHRLGETITAFDQYYFVNRLRYACAQLNRRDVLATEAHLVWARQLIQHLQGEASDLPLLRAYQQLFALLDGQGEPQFAQMQRLLSEEGSELKAESKREIYAHLINYAIRQLNEGNKAFQGHLFRLYREQLEQGILLEAGVLSPADYKNMVSLGLRQGEDQWTETFIRSYQRYLPKAQRKGAFRYQMASLHFYRAEFSDCLRILREEEFVDPFYQLGARTMILKVHFEREEFESFYYACDAFEAFLQRKSQFPSYQKPLYQNLLRFSRRLAKYYIQHRLGSSLLKKAHLQSFYQRLQSKRNTAQLDWLLDKSRQLLHEQGIASDS
ncbi:MAG: hypothetical protein AAGM67_01940, partial [Bacteroidota bacterium]